jgi:EAL domain-containing protein (putative c-di-GMP-specific phosphodiesterase class I)
MENQRSSHLAEAFSNRVLQSFQSQPFQLGEDGIYISTSIGIAIAPEHGDDTDKLVAHADIAMYQAKTHGKNNYKIFRADREDMPSHRLKIRNQLKQALEQDEFELFFQPKISLESGMIKGAEALIRWQSSKGEYRSPIEFIPIAEESGQIVPISQWVIRRSCQYLKSWGEFLPEDFALALNISAKHFQRGQLQADIAALLKQFDIRPSQLELEVTETAIMDDVALAAETLKALKALGIRTAIDDFGTGHSSLSYLRKLPIEILKIDKSFVDEILSSREDRTLVKGIIDMVHALGIEVVAEGVENHEMAMLLNDMKCDLVQGYHYCRPVCEAEFIELIRSQQCYL